MSDFYGSRSRCSKFGLRAGPERVNTGKKGPLSAFTRFAASSRVLYMSCDLESCQGRLASPASTRTKVDYQTHVQNADFCR